MRTIVSLAAAAAAIVASTSPATANLADLLHAQVKVGGKTCFARHYHYMESGAFATKAQAQAYAVKRWEGYTRNEYGAAWASYKLAHKAELTCTEGKGTRGSLTNCKIKAIPCRK